MKDVMGSEVQGMHLSTGIIRLRNVCFKVADTAVSLGVIVLILPMLIFSPDRPARLELLLRILFCGSLFVSWFMLVWQCRRMKELSKELVDKLRVE